MPSSAAKAGNSGVFAQQCVKPRKLKVCGLPSPRALRFCAAKRPNRISRVLSGCSCSPKRAKRSRSSTEEPLGLESMLESYDEVIGITHQHYIAARVLTTPSLDPQVEHIMKVDVGQQRADAPTLNRPHFALCSLALLQHTGGEPFLDQPHDAPVRHTVLDELHQPPVLQCIEEAADVGIEHPVHLSRRDPHRQCIERLMRRFWPVEIRTRNPGNPSRRSR